MKTELISSPRGWRLYLVLGGVFLTFTVLALRSYRSVDAELTEAALARRSALASLAATILSEKFDRLTDIGVSLATRERLRELIATGRWEEAAQILRRVPADFGFIERLFLTDVGGTLMADVPQLQGAKGLHLAHRDWYQQVSKSWKPAISPVYKRAAAPPRNVLAVPVPVRGSDDQVLGILVLQVRLEAFFEWARTLDVGPGGFVYVVDNKGQAAFHPEFPAQGEIADLSRDPAVRQLLRGSAGIRRGADPVSGKEQVFAFVPAAHGWGIVAQQPADTLFASRDNQLRNVLIGYFLVLLFCVAVIYLATRLLVQRRQVDADRRTKVELERQVTERTMQLEDAKETADTANRAKSAFLATMSHEIRTPMNGVLGMLELLSLTKLDAEQRTTLEVVHESSKSLLRIIDDILDFSKIEAGKLEVRPEVASISEAIEGVHKIYVGTASSKGLLVKRSVDPRISPAVWVDPVRLRQILNNFVSNALKFTSEGGIEIKAELVERVRGEDRVRFTVTDTGIGISPENQQRLFQPFVQAKGDTARRFGGTGLGLTICRRLAGMMGGSIEMESELGKGTTMVLTMLLPIADPKDLPKTDPQGTRELLTTTTRMRRAAPGVAQAEAEGTLVLLVDDHPTNRLLLMRQVHALGYAAESTEDGREALEMWKSGRFGIVITDCNMPEMDGYELARSIRRLESDRGGKRTPIIACTANALGGEAETCFAAGMDDYLAKPVELKELLKKLDQWLPIPAAGPAPSEKSGKSPGARAPRADAAAPLDRSVLAANSGGDASAERDILMEFRRVNHEDTAMLKQAVAKGDIPQVTRVTHRIKGASRMVGAMGLASVCERIEHASRGNDWTTVQANMGAFHREWMRLNAYFDSL